MTTRETSVMHSLKNWWNTIGNFRKQGLWHLLYHSSLIIVDATADIVCEFFLVVFIYFWDLAIGEKDVKRGMTSLIGILAEACKSLPCIFHRSMEGGFGYWKTTFLKFMNGTCKELSTCVEYSDNLPPTHSGYHAQFQFDHSFVSLSFADYLSMPSKCLTRFSYK